MDALLAIDQGTTSTRAILFDPGGRPLLKAQQELPQIYPADGWVEHDPEEIWRAVLAVTGEVVAAAAERGWRIARIGITNQRETAVLWERAGGRPIANAIVWQDRRTAPLCQRLIEQGHEPLVAARTGLLLDPYFSATKIGWLLDAVPGARRAALDGKLAFGTIDSFLLWRLTGGAVHATDATNAARTLLYDIHRQDWDDDLLALFGVPRALLPEIRDNVADFGTTAAGLLPERLAIGGMAGDQQAATIGQACLAPGMVKSTYGTGCFMLMNTGGQPIASRHRLLTTLAYRIGGRPTYALEGSIFVAGAAIQWLRDGLKMIKTAGESERLAAGLGHNGGVYLVPAFTGLGAPYWDPEARGAIFGLTRATGIAEIVRAALEAVCYQTSDLLAAMAADAQVETVAGNAGGTISALRVDGGMVENAWLMQFLADVLAVPVERPATAETTALGAALLAGLQGGLVGSLDAVAAGWSAAGRFTPRLAQADRQRLLDGWRSAVARLRAGVS